jgi:hypothetical protein
VLARQHSHPGPLSSAVPLRADGLCPVLCWGLSAALAFSHQLPMDLSSSSCDNQEYPQTLPGSPWRGRSEQQVDYSVQAGGGHHLGQEVGISVGSEAHMRDLPWFQCSCPPPTGHSGLARLLHGQALPWQVWGLSLSCLPSGVAQVETTLNWSPGPNSQLVSKNLEISLAAQPGWGLVSQALV